MLAHGSFGLPVLSLLLQLFALVVQTSSPRHPEKHLHVPFPEIDLERDEGESLLLCLTQQTANLLAVHKPFAHTIRLLVGPIRLFVG